MDTRFKTAADSQFAIKNAAERKVSAIFATLNVIDSDNDVTLPSEMASGQQPIVSLWGHSAMKGDPPVGRGVIVVDQHVARVDAQYFDNPEGHAAFKMVRELHESGPLEWSYGFKSRRERGSFQGKTVNFLRGIEVREVSPVAIGAGVGTRTLSAKGYNGEPATIPEHIYHALGEKSVDELRAIRGNLSYLNWLDIEDGKAASLTAIRDENAAAAERETREEVARIMHAHGFPTYGASA